MNSILEDIKKSTCCKGVFVATFTTNEPGVKTFYPYRVETNAADAEKMLQILIMMCHHPEVYAYFMEHIPSSFFINNAAGKQCAPLSPLLNYLATPVKINCLNRKKDIIEFSNSDHGVAVRQFFKAYIFPYDNKFASTFLEYFGMHRWQDTDYRKALTGLNFCNADNDLATCLTNFTTWFVSAERYDKLCMDLKEICLMLESMLYQTFCKWNQKL